MQIVTFPISASSETLITDLWESGTAGIFEDQDELHAYFPGEFDLSPLFARHPQAVASEAVVPSYLTLPSADPVLAGERFVIVDPSAAVPSHLQGNRHTLCLSASGAFGSGRHESTQLVIEALENVQLAGVIVLDVGCGTAVTSQVARLLGAASVIACDIDLDSLEQARANFPDICSFLGSADAIAANCIDVVIANISASVIDLLSAELARVTRSSGSLVLAGFTQDRVPQRFRPAVSTVKGDWLCWLTGPARLLPRTEGPSVQPFQTVWW